ncbi:nitroreductase family protein [Limisalsivibrio acetivorans]|uniref:nitroreductase family protein n=1 Tax=Limisalsivibrio acetivorans TaxID=1304888 RepID=UPI0003B51ABE|nr:nitroreductase family protein [Limisalsivibrio acetivorans]
MENLKEIIRKNRSYRKFDHSKKLDIGFLQDILYSARMSQSAANLQPLRYITVADEDIASRVFPTLAWAGYLKDWDGPSEKEQPVAYIVVLAEKESKFSQVDAGLAMQNITLSAMACGVGSCMIGNIKREQLNKVLQVPENLQILYVIALGYPVEDVRVVSMRETPDHKYYRDEDEVHYVPKRCIDDIIVGEF